MLSKIHSYSNPDNRKDWKISIGIIEPYVISVTYVPDKLLAEHNSIQNYLSECSDKEWASPEAMLLSIIEDVNNEIVPKWLRIEYKYENTEIAIEDQQPGLGNFKSPD